MQPLITIFRKEVASFFNSLIAYVVMAVFLTGVGLFFWVFEGNVLETRLASMNLLFEAGPYFFLFLVPAITMRAFAEEIRSGTVELLATKPVSSWQIILGKYLAAIFLVFFSLLPTLIYYFSLYALGEPSCNLDHGAILGSYLGLFAVGAIFAAIGLLSSALSGNQIIAFLLGVFSCFVLYQGFDLLAGINRLDLTQQFLLKVGILAHYESISRGVIDTRDLLYFLSIIGIMLLLTRMVWQSKSGHNVARSTWLRSSLIIIIVVFVNLIGHDLFRRVDLTESRRYSLSEPTLDLLQSPALDTMPAFATVYLDGEFPPNIQEFREAVRTTLVEFSQYANGNLEFEFVDPSENPELRQQFYQNRMEPLSVQVRVSETRTENIEVWAYIRMSHQDRSVMVNLMEGTRILTPNGLVPSFFRAEADLEYKLVSGLRKLLSPQNGVVAFLQGHGELSPQQVPELVQEIRFNGYLPFTLHLDSTDQYDISPSINVLMILQPTQAFSERDKYEIDQYLMRGGSILWIMDQEVVNMDLYERRSTATQLRELNLDDMFFRYGFKINYDLVQDLESDQVEVVQESAGGQNFLPRKWVFFPLLYRFPDHPISRNVDLVLMRYASSIDTFALAGVEKRIFLQSSPRSRTIQGQQFIDVSTYLNNPPPDGLFQPGNHIMGLSLEGIFSSLFTGRQAPVDSAAPHPPVATFGAQNNPAAPGRMAIISDGEFVLPKRFRGRRTGPNGRPYAIPFENKTVVINTIDYLAGDPAMTQIRAKDVVARVLNADKIEQSATAIRWLNLGLPLLLLGIFGLGRHYWRRRRFARTSA